MPACVVLRGSVLTAWRAGRVYSQLTCSLPAECCRPLVCVCILLRVCPARFSAMRCSCLGESGVRAEVPDGRSWGSVAYPADGAPQGFRLHPRLRWAEVRQALKVESRRNMALLLLLCGTLAACTLLCKRRTRQMRSWEFRQEMFHLRSMQQCGWPLRSSMAS